MWPVWWATMFVWNLWLLDIVGDFSSKSGFKGFRYSLYFDLPQAPLRKLFFGHGNPLGQQGKKISGNQAPSLVHRFGNFSLEIPAPAPVPPPATATITTTTATTRETTTNNTQKHHHRQLQQHQQKQTRLTLILTPIPTTALAPKLSVITKIKTPTHTNNQIHMFTNTNTKTLLPPLATTKKQKTLLYTTNNPKSTNDGKHQQHWL